MKEMSPAVKAALVQAGYDPNEFEYQGNGSGTGAAVGGTVGALAGTALRAANDYGSTGGLSKGALAKWLLKEYGPHVLGGAGIGAGLGALMGSGAEVWKQKDKKTGRK